AACAEAAAESAQVIVPEDPVERLARPRDFPPLRQRGERGAETVRRSGPIREGERLRDSQELPQLRMFLEKDRSGLAGPLLPPPERGERDVVMVARDRLGTVEDSHSAFRETVRQLDVLPRRVRERRVEEARFYEKTPWQRDVRRVEEIERN